MRPPERLGTPPGRPRMLKKHAREVPRCLFWTLLSKQHSRDAPGTIFRRFRVTRGSLNVHFAAHTQCFVRVEAFSLRRPFDHEIARKSLENRPQIASKSCLGHGKSLEKACSSQSGCEKSLEPGRSSQPERFAAQGLLFELLEVPRRGGTPKHGEGPQWLFVW